MVETRFPQARTLHGEKRVALRGLTWQAYQQILHALPQTRAARLTYDRGTLEITMPLEDHEFALRLIFGATTGENGAFTSFKENFMLSAIALPPSPG
nr:hypothetical protein [Desertifilum tharense]